MIVGEVQKYLSQIETALVRVNDTLNFYHKTIEDMENYLKESKWPFSNLNGNWRRLESR